MPELNIRTKQFIYRNSLKWQGQKRGLLSCLTKPDIEISTPPEFKGNPGTWTPEDLFVASINTCIMTTFLHHADKQRINFFSYTSDAEGVLERLGDKFMFSKIIVRPEILVNSNDECEKVKSLIEFSKQRCLISNSIKSEVILEVKVRLRDA